MKEMIQKLPVKKQLSLALILLLNIFTLGTYQYTAPITLPTPFNDAVLPKTQREGQWIEDLGHMIKLNTYLWPKDVKELRPKFRIYNRKNPETVADIMFVPQKICFENSCGGPFQYDLSKMLASGFDLNKRTIILISGYMTDDRVEWMQQAKDLWLRLADVNVIVVTWRSGSRGIYSRVVADTPIIARQVTIFLYYLAGLGNVQISDERFVKNIHFIGHSLGAHIAGFVGQDLNGKMGRITGLDPAGPSFDQMSRKYRLDPTDAQLVDVIHTNSGKIRYFNALAGAILSGAAMVLSKLPILNKITDVIGDGYTGEGDTAWFGIDTPVGHIDYYANDGRVQPGCAGLLHTCDHGRSHQIYVDILKHEIMLRENSWSDKWIKHSRLLAFPSGDYNSFSTGDNYKTLCPRLLNGREQLDREIDPTFRQCSMPIDMTSPLDEFKHELTTNYSFETSFIETFQPNQRYFFKTNAQSPFVGDHNLLKVHLDRSSSWDESCALKVNILMNKGISTTIEVNKQLQLVDSGQFYGIALPFVNPEGVLARKGFTNILVARVFNKTKQVDITEWLMKVVPTEIILSISGAGPTSITEALTTRVLNLGLGRKPSAGCLLNIMSVDVEPIVGFKHQVAGLYGSQVTHNDVLPVLTPKDHSSLVRNMQLLSPVLSSVAIRKLDAVVIG